MMYVHPHLLRVHRALVHCMTKTLNSLALNSLALNSLALNSLALNSLALNSLPLNSLPLNSLALNSLALNSLALNSLALNSLALNSLALNSLALNSLALNSLALNSLGSNGPPVFSRSAPFTAIEPPLFRQAPRQPFYNALRSKPNLRRRNRFSSFKSLNKFNQKTFSPKFNKPLANGPH